MREAEKPGQGRLFEAHAPATGFFRPLGEDVRLRLGASPGAATAASTLYSDRDALVFSPYGVPEAIPLASLA